MARVNGRTKVKITIDSSKLSSQSMPMVRSALLRGAQVTRERARWNLIQGGHFDTGELDQTLTFEISKSSDKYMEVRVGSPVKQALFLELGTKAHGPVTAKRLRFKPKGQAQFVFATWVRGIAPKRFMKKALESVTIYDFID